jgi:hypothetical protein
MSVPTVDRDRIFTQFRHSLGAPIRQIELTDEQLCTLLQIAIEDYSEYVQEWLIEFQWQSVFGKNISTTDMAFAMSVRSFDFMSQYTYAYSKQVGLQTNGPWELKKDYITLEAGRQVYLIPAGREVNEVLWFTPSTVSEALLANYGGIDYGFGGGFAQMGGGYGTAGTGTGGGRSGYYIAPAFDMLLTAGDMNLKNRIVRSDLAYKITAGPNGTKLLHLMSTPGSLLSFGMGIDTPGGLGNSMSIAGCQVWYFYYDTTPENVDQCRIDNPDIIMLPNQVPLSQLDFSTFNEPTKVLIRQLFVAEAKRALGRTRGKFGGIVGPPEAERTMDYETLITEGNEERKAVLERLDARLLRLSSTAQLERGANEAEFLNKQLKYRPLGFWVY